MILNLYTSVFVKNKVLLIFHLINKENGELSVKPIRVSIHNEYYSSLASQPYFSAWVALMRMKYCGGGKSRLITLARFSSHYPKTR